MKKLIGRVLERLLARPLQKLARHIEKWNAEADAARTAEEPQPETPAEPAPEAPADAVDYSLLDWRWGNFKGAKASLSSARIKSLKVGSGSLSYAWERGSCSDLDAACTHSNPSCTCALFCRVDGKWIGGKFDHISTDRRTRDFANIRKSYGGWDPAALSRADAFAFVILDDGGKRRTNVITCGR